MTGEQRAAGGELLRGARALVDAGWTRRFVVAPDRVEEAIALYERMGFAVHVEPPEPSAFGPACGDCAAAVCGSHLVVYTRREPAEDR